MDGEYEEENSGIAKYLIINSRGYLSAVWGGIDLICCLTSSYFYAWIGCFGNKEDSWFRLVDIIFETIFTISILVRFTTDFIPEGNTTPVKDHFKIAKRYWAKGFLYDFIPWIPIT